jgi:hypothetical protein
MGADVTELKKAIADLILAKEQAEAGKDDVFSFVHQLGLDY